MTNETHMERLKRLEKELIEAKRRFNLELGFELPKRAENTGLLYKGQTAHLEGFWGKVVWLTSDRIVLEKIFGNKPSEVSVIDAEACGGLKEANVNPPSPSTVETLKGLMSNE